MDCTVTSIDASNVPVGFQPLPGDGRVAFAAESCLAARSLPGACLRCEKACPVAAVRVGEAGPELVADCLGCGRCAAACPTGALTVQGFAGDWALPPGNAPLRIECWKVRESFSGHTALRVPCLGGIGIEQVLEWLARPGEKAIQFVDRGWCRECRAGGDPHPVQALIAEARRILAACGRDTPQRISLVREPLPLRLMPETIPEPATQDRLGRRAFFRRFAVAVAQTLQAPPPAVPRRRRGSDFPLPKRQRALAALASMTQRPVERLPAAVLPGLTLQKDCDHLGVCAGMCPTGALYAYEDDGHAGIGFEPRDCVACGLCAQACPARAIAVRPTGEPGQAAARILSRWPLVACTNCLTPFAAGGATLCPACRRNRTMSQQLFGTRFAGAQTRTETTFPDKES